MRNTQEMQLEKRAERTSMASQEQYLEGMLTTLKYSTDSSTPSPPFIFSPYITFG